MFNKGANALIRIPEFPADVVMKLLAAEPLSDVFKENLQGVLIGQALYRNRSDIIETLENLFTDPNISEVFRNRVEECLVHIKR